MHEPPSRVFAPRHIAREPVLRDREEKFGRIALRDGRQGTHPDPQNGPFRGRGREELDGGLRQLEEDGNAGGRLALGALRAGKEREHRRKRDLLREEIEEKNHRIAFSRISRVARPLFPSESVL